MKCVLVAEFLLSPSRLPLGHLTVVAKQFCTLNVYVVLTALKHRTGER